MKNDDADTDCLKATPCEWGEVPNEVVVARQGNPFIGVHFECCGYYRRVYRNKEGTAYVGWCPGCARKVVVKIAPDGTDCRFFRAF